MTEQCEYTYRAARRDGATETGIVDAESRDGAVAILASRNLFPIELQCDAARTTKSVRIPASDLALGLRMLATLLEAGLPASRALAALEEIVPTSWKSGLPAFREAVGQGKGLAAGLEDSPLDVPPLVVGIIRAGEGGSGHSDAVRRAAELAENSAAFRAGVLNALAYPMVLAAAGTLSMIVLVGVVLPRFSAILTDLGQTLPTSTRIVIQAGELVRAVAVPGAVASIAGVWACRAMATHEATRVRWHNMLLSLPLVGPMGLSAATARACSALSALIYSGVRIAPALIHAAGTTGNVAVTARLLSARKSIIAGQGIARALEEASALTPTAVRLIRAGEESARMADMLARAAELEYERTARMLRNGIRMIEPILILLFSAVVAVVAAALLQAVYSVRPGT